MDKHAKKFAQLQQPKIFYNTITTNDSLILVLAIKLGFTRKIMKKKRWKKEYEGQNISKPPPSPVPSHALHYNHGNIACG